MPTSVSTQRDPFRGPPAARREPEFQLRVPQARVLLALQPDCHEDPFSEWPLLTRAMLGVKAGYTPLSGSITRALNGVRDGSSSGPPQRGLIELGMVEVISLNIEGLTEDNYRITPTGVTAISSYLKENGGDLPPLKDVAICTNNRYRKGGDQ